MTNQASSTTGNLQHVGAGSVVARLTFLVPALVKLWAIAAAMTRTSALETDGTLFIWIRAVLCQWPVSPHKTSIGPWPWTMATCSPDSIAALLPSTCASANAGTGVPGQWQWSNHPRRSVLVRSLRRAGLRRVPTQRLLFGRQVDDQFVLTGQNISEMLNGIVNNLFLLFGLVRSNFVSDLLSRSVDNTLHFGRLRPPRLSTVAGHGWQAGSL